MVKLFIEFLRMKNNVTPNNAFYSLIIYILYMYVCVIHNHRIGNPNAYTQVMFIICTNIIEL